jgi:hypothetical protein
LGRVHTIGPTKLHFRAAQPGGRRRHQGPTGQSRQRIHVCPLSLLRWAHLSATSSQQRADRVPLPDRARSSFTRRIMSPTRGTEASGR